jgi:uncharacterized membrane protein YhaH (DUF805 family)
MKKRNKISLIIVLTWILIYIIIKIWILHSTFTEIIIWLLKLIWIWIIMLYSLWILDNHKNNIVNAIKSWVNIYINKIIFYFTAHWRVSRWEYFWAIIILWPLLFVTLLVIKEILYPLVKEDIFAIKNLIVLTIPLLPIFWIIICKKIKRLHDFDTNWLFVILTFIPWIWTILELLLWFVNGTKWKNRFWEQKPFIENF